VFIPTSLRDAKPAVFIPTAFRAAKHAPVTDELVEAKRQRREEGGSSTDAATPTAAATGRIRGSAATATAGRRDQRVATAKLLERRDATQLVADKPTWEILGERPRYEEEMKEEWMRMWEEDEAAKAVQKWEVEQEKHEGGGDVVPVGDCKVEDGATVCAKAVQEWKVEQEKHDGWGALATVGDCKLKDGTTAAASIDSLLDLAGGLAEAEDAGGAAAMLEASGLTDSENAGGAAADGTGDTVMNADNLVDALVDDALVDAYDAAEDAAVALVLRRTRVMDVLVDPYF
jgi:hypothetical protein